VACGPDAAPANRLPVTDDPDSGPSRGGPFDSGRPPIEVPDGADPLLPDGGKPPGKIYANTATTLYRYDPLANTIVTVGVFDCVPHGGVDADDDSVIDMALDRTGQLYATTFYRFIKVDAATAKCTVVKTQDTTGKYPNSLSFVPLGTVDNAREALVGYSYDINNDARVYTRIDVDTGEPTTIGDINPTPLLNGVEWGISGDFISLARDQSKTYGTVTQLTGDAGAGNDQLAELDPKTGVIKRIIGDIGQIKLFGMGYWAGKAYVFSSLGGIYEVDITTGHSKLALLPTPDGGGSIVWYGAGVTTDTPTAP
jgi:hypothetical protein